MQDMSHQTRQAERIPCTIEIAACTAVSSRVGRIVDLTRFGAQIRMSEPYEARARIFLELDGDYTWATVVWSEVDRIGVRFEAPLSSGSLHQRFETLRSKRTNPRPVHAAMPHRMFGRKAA